jgi:D-alanine-D-alanine ligase
LEAEYAIFACHGSLGENGKLEAFFEMFGIYSSAGRFDSLAICMNKFLFKQTMKGLDVPVVRGFKLTKKDVKENRERVQMLLKFMKFPVIVKSNNGGSSIGMFVSKNYDEFYENLKSAFEFDEEVLVEKYISNAREFNLAVLGNCDEYEISEIDEPLKEHEILSFSDKYLSGGFGKKSNKMGLGLKNSMAGQSRRLPADIPEELRNKIRNYAKKIFVSLGLSGIVRIDFLFDEENNKLYVCELNAIPGSLAFYFFKENKILVNKLVQNLINDAMFNKEKNTYFKDEFSTTILE